MESEHTVPDSHEPPILPEDVPVVMPTIPLRLTIDTMQQFKAMSDSTRTRIIAIIQQQPLTAKQIADRLNIPPGTIGHHLQVLEAAGLAKVVARRQVRGTVAKYYTRTARIFLFYPPLEAAAQSFLTLDFVREAHNELLDLQAQPGGTQLPNGGGFPHARLSPARAEAYTQRLYALMDEFIQEPTDPDGTVVSLCVALFTSPDYLQVGSTPQAALQPPEEE